jgi:hypothetical protein
MQTERVALKLSVKNAVEGVLFLHLRTLPSMKALRKNGDKTPHTRNGGT